MPSWVPDWRVGGPAIPVTREFALSSNFPQMVPSQFEQEHSETGLPAALLLQAHILDTADWFNLTPGAENVLQCSYELLTMVDKMKSEYVIGGSARVALWKAMIADSVNALPAPEGLTYSFVQFSYVIGYGKLKTPVDDIVGNDFANDPNPLLRFLDQNMYAKAITSERLTVTQFFRTAKGFLGWGPRKWRVETLLPSCMEAPSHLF
jgi:hypothetical protein